MRAHSDPFFLKKGRFSAWLQGSVAAFQFLSRLPLPFRIQYDDATFKRSVPFYPLVGCVIGLLLWLLAGALASVLPVLPASILVLIGWACLTGGLHLDGLMDTADGILSHRPREQMLEIMKDSRVGAMGVIVCVLHLLLKGSLIYIVIEQGWHASVLPFVVIPAWSRWWMTAAIAGWPYARPNSGMGSFFKDTPKSYVFIGAIISLIISTAAAFFQPSLSLSLFIPLVMVITGMAVSLYFARKLGGLTGDTYGASNELVESAGLLASVVLMS